MAKKQKYVTLCGHTVPVQPASFAKDGLHARTMGTPPLAEPTDAWPGTWEKLEVMRSRAMSGRQIFHPDDPHALGIRSTPPRGEVELTGTARRVVEAINASIGKKM